MVISKPKTLGKLGTYELAEAGDKAVFYEPWHITNHEKDRGSRDKGFPSLDPWPLTYLQGGESSSQTIARSVPPKEGKSVDEVIRTERFTYRGMAGILEYLSDGGKRVRWGTWTIAYRSDKSPQEVIEKAEKVLEELNEELNRKRKLIINRLKLLGFILPEGDEKLHSTSKRLPSSPRIPMMRRSIHEE